MPRMKKALSLLTGVLSATVLLSQTLPSALPSQGPKIYKGSSAEYAGEMWLFQLGDKHYRARITKEEILAGPEWRPTVPPPLSLARAEEIGRGELRKLGVDDAGWEVTDLHLKRLRSSDQAKWYYVVRLAPREDNAASESFFAVISFSGKPGVVEPDPNPR